MRTLLTSAFSWLLAVQLAPLCGTLNGAGMSVGQVLGKIEARGKTLRSMSAKIRQKKWTDILQEFDAGESGRFLFFKKGRKVYLRRDLTSPQESSLVIRDGRLLFYQPAIKQAQKHDLGQNRDKAEFLLIGFGSSRKSLEETYVTRLSGRELLGGHNAYVLELTPRSDRVAAFFSRIVLWVDPEMWVPVQQKLVEPTEDYLLVEFSDIQLNPKISESDFRLKLPKDVKIVGN
ncbi:MAG: outer membrane lipoprotein carrier protein LolA [Acidobacteriota bacterium]